MLRKLFSFNGGVKPDPNKSASTREPIARLPLPPQLVIPLHQHIGGTPRPLVHVGDKVLRGQRIGAADGNVSSAVHAPTSGHVVAIEPRPMPHASGLSSPAVVIEPDPRLKPAQTAIIEIDYGMQDGQLLVPSRGALVQYVLQRFQIDANKVESKASAQQIVSAPK